MQGVGPAAHANDAGATRRWFLKALKGRRLEAAQAHERKGLKLGRAARRPAAGRNVWIKENSIFRRQAGARLRKLDCV